MAHPYHHSLSSVRKWGGKPEDYQPIHDWFDATKACFADFRHRAARHHAEGIFLCESLFGTIITNSAGQAVPVRLLGEQHVREDLGFIPSLQDWLKHLRPQPWMTKRAPTSPTRHSPPAEAITRPHLPDPRPESHETN